MSKSPTTAHAEEWQCPACGDWWSDDITADYCQGCHEKVVFEEDADNQNALDLYNTTFDRWERMTDRERGDEIRRAMQ